MASRFGSLSTPAGRDLNPYTARQSWPERARPSQFVGGRFYFRTVFPSDISHSALRARPAFYPSLWDEDELYSKVLIDREFPGLLPRTAWKRSPDSTVYGLSFAAYIVQLFNLEGALQRSEPLNWEMIAAGLALILQDQLDIAWFPTTTAWQTTTRGPIGSNMTRDVHEKSFAVLIVFVPRRDNGHWMAAIVDRTENCVYWYNSVPSYSDAKLSSVLGRWLKKEKLVPKTQVIRHVNVPITGQKDAWESGLFVLECIRCFFREPFIGKARGPTDWTVSRQYHRPVPVLGALDDTSKKTAWTIASWCGWIRAELGHFDLSGLRQPACPSVPFGENLAMNIDGHTVMAPNCLGEADLSGLSAQEINAMVARQLGPDPNDREKALESVQKVESRKVAIIFDTWISGEAGQFFIDWMDPNATTYSYTKFRFAVEPTPEKYAMPLLLNRGDRDSSDIDSLVGDCPLDSDDEDGNQTESCEDEEHTESLSDSMAATKIKSESEEEEVEEMSTIHSLQTKTTGSETSEILSSFAGEVGEEEEEKEGNREVGEKDNEERKEREKKEKENKKKSKQKKRNAEEAGIKTLVIDPGEEEPQQPRSTHKRPRLKPAVTRQQPIGLHGPASGKHIYFDDDPHKLTTSSTPNLPRRQKSLYDHSRSPRTHLSPDHIPGWRGWQIEEFVTKRA